MTTSVKVDAHAGWPVRVRQIDVATGIVRNETIVAPHTDCLFHVWDGLDLRISEMRRDEAPASAPAAEAV